jgi:protein-S-isoprenylcysteine O-methyltransferase Ste14
MDLIYIEKMGWLALFFYWVFSAFQVKKTIRRQADWRRVVYIFFVILAFSLLFEKYIPFSFLYQTVLPQNTAWKIGGLILCMTGLLFAFFARVRLGKNWSGRITVKENHELVQSGPYRITRNPIYTGFLAAFCGTAMTVGELRGYLGIPLMAACLLIKISKEEEFMLETFGDKFREYQKKVKRLIPLIY